MYDPEDPDINEGTLPNYISTYKLDAKFLDQVAETTLDKILNSSFVPPKY
jgi:hypothetical protein